MATQQDVLSFVIAFVQAHGYQPSYREIGKGVGIRSTATVSYHLGRLEEQGLLTKVENRTRGIALAGVGQTVIFPAVSPTKDWRGIAEEAQAENRALQREVGALKRKLAPAPECTRCAKKDAAIASRIKALEQKVADQAATIVGLRSATAPIPEFTPLPGCGHVGLAGMPCGVCEEIIRAQQWALEAATRAVEADPAGAPVRLRSERLQLGEALRLARASRLEAERVRRGRLAARFQS